MEQLPAIRAVSWLHLNPGKIRALATAKLAPLDQRSKWPLAPLAFLDRVLASLHRLERGPVELETAFAVGRLPVFHRRRRTHIRTKSAAIDAHQVVWNGLMTPDAVVRDKRVFGLPLIPVRPLIAQHPDGRLNNLPRFVIGPMPIITIKAKRRSQSGNNRPFILKGAQPPLPQDVHCRVNDIVATLATKNGSRSFDFAWCRPVAIFSPARVKPVFVKMGSLYHHPHPAASKAASSAAGVAGIVGFSGLR